VSQRNPLENGAASPKGDTFCDNDGIVLPFGLVVSLAFQDRWLTPNSTHFNVCRVRHEFEDRRENDKHDQSLNQVVDHVCGPAADTEKLGNSLASPGEIP